MKVKMIPDYSQVDGFIKLTFLKRIDTRYAYFDLITYWENMDVIKEFAGKDFEKAKILPRRQKIFD